jgi:putative oxidoreductase
MCFKLLLNNMNKLLSPAPLAQSNGIAIVRIITGLFMIYHGWDVFSAEKMNVYTEWDQFKNETGRIMVYIGKGAELVAGILLVLGLFTRIAAIMMILTLGYIAFFVGNGKVWADAQHPFLFVLLGLVFVFTGPGAMSLDNTIFRRK